MRFVSICFGLLALTTFGYSQTRRALLIGINSYEPPKGATLPVPAEGHAPDSRFARGDSWQSLRGPLVDVASMKALLQHPFAFQDIRLLTEQQATRQGILAAIDQLVADTHPGDLDVIYYAGHGSRRRDTLSSKNQMDETIVPIDAWKGAEDIRDKELAVRFNQIVYDKQAHLTAIFDSCNSGTMARGATRSTVRALPYDDRDVAEEKKKDPTTIVEADLKRIPQNGDAIIVAAAASNESAAEAQYDDDRQFHGSFSRALVRVLRSSTQAMGADDVVAEVSNLLHADPTPFQQPSLEGRIHQSLFGEPVTAHALHVHVVNADGPVTLDMGSAAGFDTGTQFTAVEPAAGGQKTVLEVQKVDEPLLSTARIVKGPAPKVGQAFELTKETYPRGARLTIFAAKSEPDPSAAITQAKSLFPGLTWVDDPTVKPVDFLVANSGGGWIAYGQKGQTIAPGPDAKGAAFLLLGPSPSVRAAIEQSIPFQRNAFTFTTQPSDARYLLTMRLKPDATAEYALFDGVVLTPHPPDAWVTSQEVDDGDDGEARLNGGQEPEVVCRNNTSLPVRTAWLRQGKTEGNLIKALNRRIVRLGKLRLWLESAALAPGAAGWPYHLEITPAGSGKPTSGMWRLDEEYDVGLATTAEQRAANAPIPKYVYIFGFDCAANPFMVYPREGQNGDATLPPPGADGVYGLSVPLDAHETIGTPLGADTLFMLVTPQKLLDTDVLLKDGELDRHSKGPQQYNKFDELIGEMSDPATRGPKDVLTNWLVQKVLMPSTNRPQATDKGR